MTDFTETSWSAGQSFSQIREDAYGSMTFLTGIIATRVGIMRVYSQGDARAVHSTMIEVVVAGRCRRRNWRKRFTARGIARKANEWAREIEAKTLGQVARIEELKAAFRELSTAVTDENDTPFISEGLAVTELHEWERLDALFEPEAEQDD